MQKNKPILDLSKLGLVFTKADLFLVFHPVSRKTLRRNIFTDNIIKGLGIEISRWRRAKLFTLEESAQIKKFLNQYAAETISR